MHSMLATDNQYNGRIDRTLEYSRNDSRDQRRGDVVESYDKVHIKTTPEIFN